MRSGTGCEDYQQSCPGRVHNPEPRTERGKRRHAKRNEEQQKVAVKAWAKPRSAYPRCRPNNGVKGKLTSETFTMKAAA